jgi:hypothetical protein
MAERLEKAGNRESFSALATEEARVIASRTVSNGLTVDFKTVLPKQKMARH